MDGKPQRVLDMSGNFTEPGGGWPSINCSWSCLMCCRHCMSLAGPGDPGDFTAAVMWPLATCTLAACLLQTLFVAGTPWRPRWLHSIRTVSSCIHFTWTACTLNVIWSCWNTASVLTSSTTSKLLRHLWETHRSDWLLFALGTWYCAWRCSLALGALFCLCIELQFYNSQIHLSE